MAGASVSAWRRPRVDLEQRRARPRGRRWRSRPARSPTRCRGSAPPRPQIGGCRRGQPRACQRRAPTGPQRRASRSSSLVAEARAAPRGSRRAARPRMASPHSISVTPSESSSSPRAEVDRPRPSAPGGTRRRGACAGGQGTCVASVNVGLVTGSVDAEGPRRSPARTSVLPAPRSPTSSSRSPARTCSATTAGQRLRRRRRRRCAARTVMRVDAPAVGQRQLGPHEVGPHLGQRRGPAPQRRRRVQRRDEHAVGERVGAAPQLA